MGKSLLDDNHDYLGSGLKLAAAIKKYGRANFEKTILENCESDNLDLREIYWIEELNACNDNIGYNISTGGTGGNHYWNSLDEEGKQKLRQLISESKLGVSINYTTMQRENVKKHLIQYHKNKTSDDYKKIREKTIKNYIVIKNCRILRMKGLTKFCKDQRIGLSGLTSIATGNRIYPDNGYYCFYDNDESDNEVLLKVAELEYKQHSRKQEWLKKIRSRPRYACEFCGEETTAGNLKRWHGENCRSKL